jgi:DNA-binding transcriptional LysR family regulator
MEWQQLLGFCQAAKLGSFTKAAEATFRTQSALTQQVKALEEELQCLLFERSGRGVRLTRAGERLLQFAEETFAAFDLLKEDLHELLGQPRGVLKLAAPFTTLYHLLPGAVKEYAARFPQVELTILDRPQREVIILVQRREVDFGLVLESLVPKNLTKIRWRRVRTALMVPQGHPLTQARQVSLQALARHPLILPPQSLEYAGRERLEDMFRREALHYQVIMESANVELTALYVEMGLGIGFATISQDFMPQKGRKLAFLPLDHYFLPGDIVVIMKELKALSPYKQAFLDILRLGADESLVHTKGMADR